jgi:hypothetical protein
MTDDVTAGEGEERRRSKVAAAYRAYSWIDRARKAWTWLFGVGSANTAVGTGAVTAVVLATGLTVNDVVDSRTRTATLEAQIARQSAVVTGSLRRAPSERLGEEAVVFAVAGRDKAGRRATFDLIVLDRSFVWSLGSTEIVERAGSKLAGEEVVRTIVTRELGDRIRAAEQLIAVGTASSEGGKSEEETRAAARATRLAQWLGQAVAGKPIWSLNLGQHRERPAEAGRTGETTGTSWQRPIIVVGVRASQEGVDIGEALADAMQSSANLPHPATYSRYDMNRVR